MKYFIDTEFLEGKQDKTIFGVKYGKTKPTIDLISIGIVSEDNREYYAVSKEFNLKEAWNRFDLKLERPEDSRQRKFKEYWIRENVLKPIYNELAGFHINNYNTKSIHFGYAVRDYRYLTFTCKNLKWLINKYGKTNKQIAEEVKEFCSKDYLYKNADTTTQWKDRGNPEFYGYYADYDWVAFCWLFGKMIDLPKGFPWYCIDLEQEFDRVIESLNWGYNKDVLNDKDVIEDRPATHKEKLDCIKTYWGYPKQTNEHHALIDARWNKKLFEFLNNNKL